MKCPKCNEDIKKGIKFCTKCGANIEEATKEKEEEIRKLEEEKRLEEEKKMEEQKKLEEEQKKIEEQKRLEEEKKKLEESKEKVESEAAVQKNIEKKEIKEEVKEEIKEDVKENVNDKTPSEDTTEIKTDKSSEKKFDKKEPAPKKKHTGLKVVLILMIILILAIGGGYGLYKINVLPDSISSIYEKVEGWLGIEKEDKNDEEDKKVENKTENKVDNKTEVKEKDKEIEKIDEDEGLVYDYKVHSFKIPRINLDVKNIKKINSEIEDLVEDDDTIFSTDYRWYENDDILSLVFLIKNENLDNEYYVYNVNTKTGETVDNSEILEAVNLSESKLASTCISAIEKEIEEDILVDKDKTLDQSSYSVRKAKIYINDEALIVIAKIYSIDGSETEKIINLYNAVNQANKTSTINSYSTQNTTDNSTTTYPVGNYLVTAVPENITY